MGLVELYALCSSILAIIVYSVIIREIILKFKYRREMERKARRAWLLLDEAQRLTKELLKHG